MNNPYNQFNIRPRPNVRFRAVLANAAASGFNSANVNNPTLGTVNLLSPTIAYDNQRLYNALYSNRPAMPMSGTMDFGAVAQAAFNQWLAAQMANGNSGVTFAPVGPLDVSNQLFRPNPPTNFTDALGMRMCSSVQPSDLLRQFVSGNSSAVQNRMPVMQPQVTSVRQPFNVPEVTVIPNSLDNTADILSSDVNIPFREVQWVPPAVQETGVPQVPYALEIKPENCATPQNRVPFGSTPVINTGANYTTECVNEQSAPSPAVYLDIAMDSSMHCLDTGKMTLGLSSTSTDFTVVKETGKTVKRKRSQCKSKSKVKVLKLPDINSIRPCVVSLVRLDISSIRRPKSNDIVEDEEISVADSEELNECGVDASPGPEIQEPANSQDTLEPTTHDGSQEPEIPVQEIGNSEEIPLTVIEYNTSNTNVSDSDQLIGSDEDVGADDPPYDDDKCSASEDVGSEKSVCYEVVPTDSDALLFDMECDGEKAGGTLRVLLPTKKFTGTGEKMGLAKKTVPPAAKTRMEKKTVLPAAKTGLPKKTVSPAMKTGLARNTVPITPKLALAASMPLLSSMLAIAPKTETKESDTIPAEASTTDSLTPRLRRLAANVCMEKIKTAALNDLEAESDTEVAAINVDDSDDDFDITAEVSAMNSEMTELQCSSAVKELETLEVKRSVNSLLGVPFQSSFFRCEAQSPEVFRLLSMERSRVPHTMLALLADLVASSSVDATSDDKQSSNGDASSGTVNRIPRGESRTLLFQCLFCPYGEMSAKRVMAHVKQQHYKYASFIQRSLLPARQFPLHIFCRHCNFVAYDGAAMFIHFAVYHSVAGILSLEPKTIEHNPVWAPPIDPGAHAAEFPFYCCPNCSYLDAEWSRIIQHMIEKHSTQSVLLDCVVRLIMVGRASKHLFSFTYETLARQEKCKVARKEIFACVSCRYFSFYPTYAFCHYIVSHSNLEMLYMCATSSSCSKRFSSIEEFISHIRDIHTGRKCLQFQCTATLFDSVTSTELAISPGKLDAADVPVCSLGPSTVSIHAGSQAAIEIVDDDDEDDDLVVLSPASNIKSDDVEPDSEECSVPGKSEPSSEPATTEQDVGHIVEDKTSTVNAGESTSSVSIQTSSETEQDFQETSSSREHPVGEKMSEHRREENSERDGGHIVEDKTPTVNADDTACNTMDSVCSNEDQYATGRVQEHNSEAGVQELVAADVPVSCSGHVAVPTSSEAAIEIVDDDDDDDDDDVVVLSPAPNDRTDDVEPDSPLSEERNDCTSVPGNSELSSEPAATEQNIKGTADVEHIVEAKTLTVNAGDTACNTVDSVCSNENRYVTELVQTSTESKTAIDIADDDDSDDVMILSPGPNESKYNDVERDSALSEECSDCTGVPGNSEPADAPMCSSLSSSVTVQTSSEAAIEIADDDVMVLSPAPKDSKSDDLERDSALLEECSDCTGVPGNSEPADVLLSSSVTVQTSSEAAIEIADDDVMVLSPAPKDSKSDDLERDSALPEECSEVKKNSEVDLDRNVDDETSKITACDSECEVTEQEPGRPESQSVWNPGTVGDFVDSVVDSTFPNKDAKQLADSAAVVADLANHSGVCSNDESFIESESILNPVTGTSQTDSAADPTFMSKDQLADTDTVVADLLNHESVPANDESAECLAVHQTDDFLQLEGTCDDFTVNDGEVVNPKLNDARTSEQELLTSDQPNTAELYTECLGFDEDILSGFELPQSPSNRIENREGCTFDLDEEVLLLSKQLSADEPPPQEHSSNVQHAVLSRSDASSTENLTDVGLDDSLIVSMDNPCLAEYQDMSDDAFCSDAVESEQLRALDDSWNQEEADAVNNSVQQHCDETLLPSHASCSSEIPSESRDSETSEQTDTTNEQCGGAAEPDSVNLLRFKSLSGFRFPVPSWFNAKPN